jgi:hypothetical protein
MRPKISKSEKGKHRDGGDKTNVPHECTDKNPEQVFCYILPLIIQSSPTIEIPIHPCLLWHC